MIISKIPNQIINGKMTPLNKSRVNSIALHHMAHPTADVKQVERWHIDWGWIAIGYNYWIGFDGTVYEGRGLNQGAGVANQNSTIISIGFQGDYHSNPVTMPDVQFDAGVDTIKYIMDKMPAITKVGGHKDYMATECPGKYFPLADMITLKKWSSEEPIEELDTINDIVWELAERGIITNKVLWLSKLLTDVNAYWLARKCVNYIRKNSKI